jgi:hypothetical protein
MKRKKYKVMLTAEERQQLQRLIAAGKAAWEEERNERGVEAKWRFTTADARIKLHKLYPSPQ